ncbi:hypothetical protein KSP39_PZI021703 [Platanthera zijinensis]|uniref:Retrotransposon gag domain-containing protein n=1 Tax=Platanthera zijinensis TaxID=2320716 RepID=A0AAP0AY66_9ASPA
MAKKSARLTKGPALGRHTEPARSPSPVDAPLTTGAALAPAPALEGRVRQMEELQTEMITLLRNLGAPAILSLLNPTPESQQRKEQTITRQEEWRQAALRQQDPSGTGGQRLPQEYIPPNTIRVDATHAARNKPTFHHLRTPQPFEQVVLLPSEELPAPTRPGLHKEYDIEKEFSSTNSSPLPATSLPEMYDHYLACPHHEENTGNTIGPDTSATKQGPDEYLPNEDSPSSWAATGTEIHSFSGTGNPLAHLKHFEAIMHTRNASDQLMIRVFATTLIGEARTWLQSLQREDTDSYIELAALFIKRFMMIKKPSPENMRSGRKQKRKKEGEPTHTMRKERRQKRSRPNGSQHSPPRKGGQHSFQEYIPPSTTCTNVVYAIQNNSSFQRPRAPRPNPKADQARYCEYHRSHGHNTNECKGLKEEVQRLTNLGAADQSIRRPPNNQSIRCTTVEIGKPPVKLNQVLIDKEVTTNILFLPTLLQLKLTAGYLKLTSANARVLGDHPVPIIGTITLPVTLKDAHRQTSYDVQFVVIQANSDYTAILQQSLWDFFQSCSSHLHP